MKYVGTNEQMADMLTKASFTVQKWQNMLNMHQIGDSGIQKPYFSPHKGCIKTQKRGSVVLAQQETETYSASGPDFAPSCFCAMPAPASSSTDWGPKPPSSPPPGFEPASSKAKAPRPPSGPPPGLGLLLKQIPTKTAELEAELPDFELPDWSEDMVPAESDLCHEADNLQDLIHQFDVSMTARKYSFTRKSRAQAVSIATNTAPDLTNLNDEIFQQVRKKNDQERADIATKLYKAFNGLVGMIDPKNLTSVQWSEIFYDVINSVGVHNEKLKEMGFGILNEEKYETDPVGLSKFAISMVGELVAQGDLCFAGSSQFEAMINKPEYLQLRPYANPFNIDMFESEIYFFSDSVTKLGKKAPASKFEKHHDENLSGSGTREQTNHGVPYKIIWNCESNCTGMQMKNKVKSIIDTLYDGNPTNFKGRIVIFGCLNDLRVPAKTRDEPLKQSYRRAAEEIRNYLQLFEVGRVIWLGPGSEKIWNYDGRNMIWDPWAEEFMKIIAESGIPIFKGKYALSGRVLRAQGQNEHLEDTLSNRHMLIKFIHSSLKIASFVCMIKEIPEDTAAENKDMDEDRTSSDAASDMEIEVEKDDQDPLNLERLCLSPRKEEATPTPQWAPPVPSCPGEDNSNAAGDGSGAMGNKEGGIASGDGSEEKVSKPYTDNQAAAPAAKIPDHTAASYNTATKIPDDKIPKKEKNSIARSDASKEAKSSRKRITRSKCILTPVAKGEKVILKPATVKGQAILTPAPGAFSDEGRELDELDELHQTQQNIKNNEFTYDIFVSLKKSPIIWWQEATELR